MKLAQFSVLLLFQLGYCIKIFEWQRDWGDGTLTRELAQIIPEWNQIIHSATDTGAPYGVPAISLSIYRSLSADFPDGLMVIRPLLSEGHQICFIGHISRHWSTDYNTLQYRHGATISIDKPVTYDLQTDLPGDLDPLSFASVRDFCDVDRSHVFFMASTNNEADNDTLLRVQGPFEGYSITVGDTFKQTILDILMKMYIVWVLPKPSIYNL